MAIRGAVFGEVAGRDHCSYHTGIQHPPADPELHQSKPRRQGTKAMHSTPLHIHVSESTVSIYTKTHSVSVILA